MRFSFGESYASRRTYTLVSCYQVGYFISRCYYAGNGMRSRYKVEIGNLMRSRCYYAGNFMPFLYRCLPILSSSIAGFFGRFLGSEVNGNFLIILALVLCCFIFLFRRYSFQLKEKYRFGLLVFLWHFLILFGIGILGSLIRIYVFSHLGLDLTTVFPIVFVCFFDHNPGASSELFTYTSDLEEDSASSGRSGSTSSVNQPIPREHAGPSSHHPAREIDMHFHERQEIMHATIGLIKSCDPNSRQSVYTNTLMSRFYDPFVSEATPERLRQIQSAITDIGSREGSERPTSGMEAFLKVLNEIGGEG